MVRGGETAAAVGKKKDETKVCTSCGVGPTSFVPNWGDKWTMSHKHPVPEDTLSVDEFGLDPETCGPAVDAHPASSRMDLMRCILKHTKHKLGSEENQELIDRMCWGRDGPAADDKVTGLGPEHDWVFRYKMEKYCSGAGKVVEAEEEILSSVAEAATRDMDVESLLNKQTDKGRRATLQRFFKEESREQRLERLRRQKQLHVLPILALFHMDNDNLAVQVVELYDKIYGRRLIRPGFRKTIHKHRVALAFAINNVLAKNACPRPALDIARAVGLTCSRPLLNIPVALNLASEELQQLDDDEVILRDPPPSVFVDTVCAMLNIDFAYASRVVELLEKHEWKYYGRHPMNVVAAGIKIILREEGLLRPDPDQIDKEFQSMYCNLHSMPRWFWDRRSVSLADICTLLGVLPRTVNGIAAKMSENSYPASFKDIVCSHPLDTEVDDWHEARALAYKMKKEQTS